jgi:hypothetical protein
MKRPTAIGRLVSLAEQATAEVSRFGTFGDLAELWAAGSVLDPDVDPVEVVTIVFSLDIPPSLVPWRSRPSKASMVTHVYRLNKLPIAPVWRPAAWPAWNPEFRRVARFWTADDGLDEQLIGRMRAGEPVGEEPDPAEFEAQMREELAVSRRHLDAVLDGFDDRRWRKAHRGDGLYPGDHVWMAAKGYREVERVLSSEVSRAPTVHRLKVTLRDVDPPIWRRVLVASETRLDEAAWLLNRAMGWSGSHLHAFDVDGTRYGIVDPEFSDMNQLDEARYALADVLATPGSTLRYDYDFGDGWEHDVEAEAIDPTEDEQTYPAVIAGARACPPDDIGGPPGYQDALDCAVAGEALDPDTIGIRLEPGFDPEHFDIATADEQIREPPPPW